MFFLKYIRVHLKVTVNSLHVNITQFNEKYIFLKQKKFTENDSIFHLYKSLEWTFSFSIQSVAIPHITQPLEDTTCARERIRINSSGLLDPLRRSQGPWASPTTLWEHGQSRRVEEKPWEHRNIRAAKEVRLEVSARTVIWFRVRFQITDLTPIVILKTVFHQKYFGYGGDIGFT